MAIDPSELSTETLAVLTELAEESGKSGKDLATTLREAVDALKRRPRQEESWLDTAYMDQRADLRRKLRFGRLRWTNTPYLSHSVSSTLPFRSRWPFYPSAVIGSIIFRTWVTCVAGKPLLCACSWINASSSAR